jgi:hypothetical protein
MSYYKTRFETTIYPNLTRLWKPSVKPPVNRPIKRPQNLLENVLENVPSLYFNDGFFSSLLYFERAFPPLFRTGIPSSISNGYSPSISNGHSLLYFERAFPYHINPDPPDSVYVNGLIIGTPELIAWP